MTAPTSAVERAASAIHSEIGRTNHLYATTAQVALTAALSDPDDPDSLARTLFVAHVMDARLYSTAANAVQAWGISTEARRDHWRAVAAGLTSTLVGEGS